MADDIVIPETGVIYTDTNAIPQWAKETWETSAAYTADYPAQTRTYVTQSKNWDMTGDYTASGLSNTQFSWTRTELHN